MDLSGSELFRKAWTRQITFSWDPLWHATLQDVGLPHYRPVSTMHARQVSCARRVLRSQGQGFSSQASVRGAPWLTTAQPCEWGSAATSLAALSILSYVTRTQKLNNVSCQIHTGSLNRSLFEQDVRNNNHLALQQGWTISSYSGRPDRATSKWPCCEKSRERNLIMEHC